MKNKFLKAIALCSVLLLTACNEEVDTRLYEGYVVDKIFVEGYAYTTTVYVNQVPMTQVHIVPDTYYIVIYKNEEIEKYQISKEYYDTLTVGSYVNLEKNIEVIEDE